MGSLSPLDWCGRRGCDDCRVLQERDCRASRSPPYVLRSAPFHSHTPTPRCPRALPASEAAGRRGCSRLLGGRGGICSRDLSSSSSRSVPWPWAACWSAPARGRRRRHGAPSRSRLRRRLAAPCLIPASHVAAVAADPMLLFHASRVTTAQPLRRRRAAGNSLRIVSWSSIEFVRVGRAILFTAQVPCQSYMHVELIQRHFIFHPPHTYS